MKNNGFSFVELIVVVAIIAVLASIAMPYYISYRSRVKMSQVRRTMDNFVQQSKSYYNEHAVFPVNSQLGVVAEYPASVNEYLVKPYVPFVLFSVSNSEPSGRCDYTIISSFISNYGTGDFFIDDNSTVTSLKYWVINTGDTMVVKCQATEYENMLETSNIPFPECDSDGDNINIQSIIDSCMF